MLAQEAAFRLIDFPDSDESNLGLHAINGGAGAGKRKGATIAIFLFTKGKNGDLEDVTPRLVLSAGDHDRAARGIAIRLAGRITRRSSLQICRHSWSGSQHGLPFCRIGPTFLASKAHAQSFRPNHPWEHLSAQDRMPVPRAGRLFQAP